MSRNLQQSLYSIAGGAVWGATHILIPQGIQDSFGGDAQEQSRREIRVRLEERREERTRIARELHDTLFQGFVGASMVLHDAVERMPADSPSKSSLSRALQVMRRVIDEGRHALSGLRSSTIADTGLEKALAEVGKQFPNSSAELRVLVMGQAVPSSPVTGEQVYLVCREALVNALRHSGATSIEADIEYLRDRVRVVIRDNGYGITPKHCAPQRARTGACKVCASAPRLSAPAFVSGAGPHRAPKWRFPFPTRFGPTTIQTQSAQRCLCKKPERIFGPRQGSRARAAVPSPCISRDLRSRRGAETRARTARASPANLTRLC
jgi:hypothetical protein